MHSHTAYVDGQGYNYLHNGDYSGEIIISGVTVQDDEVSVPFEVLKEIVGQAMISDHVSQIEDQTGRDYLEARLRP